MQVNPRHGEHVQHAALGTTVPQRIDDLRLAPIAEASFGIGCEIAADEDTMRICPHFNAPREVVVITPIDTASIDHRVAQAAHFSVHQVRATPCVVPFQISLRDSTLVFSVTSSWGCFYWRGACR